MLEYAEIDTFWYQEDKITHAESCFNDFLETCVKNQDLGEPALWILFTVELNNGIKHSVHKMN